MREGTRSKSRIVAAAGRAFAAAAVILSGASLAILALPAETASATTPPPANPSTIGTIYDNIPSPLPGNLPSQAFEATSTSEFGGALTMDSGGFGSSVDDEVTVLMSSWGCQSGHWYDDTCATTPGSTFSEPITLNVYGPGMTIGGVTRPAGPPISVTQTFQIPFRPSSDDTHCTGGNVGKWYDAASNTCFNGLATPIKFNLAGIKIMDNAVITVAYNTSDYGADPYGDNNPCNSSSAGCGYDSLNVALTGPPSVGSDPLPNDAYLDSNYAGSYCDSNPDVGNLVLDHECWTGLQPAIRVQAGLATQLDPAPSIAQIIPGLSINLKLSAQLTTFPGIPLAFEPVTFTVGGSLVCGGITNASGTASCSIGAGVLQSVLALGYQASFAGDGNLEPSSAHGPILIVLGKPIF